MVILSRNSFGFGVLLFCCCWGVLWLIQMIFHPLFDIEDFGIENFGSTPAHLKLPGTAIPSLWLHRSIAARVLEILSCTFVPPYLASDAAAMLFWTLVNELASDKGLPSSEAMTVAFDYAPVASSHLLILKSCHFAFLRKPNFSPNFFGIKWGLYALTQHHSWPYNDAISYRENFWKKNWK